MPLALSLLALASLLELSLWLPGMWRWRKPLICGLIPVISVTSGLTFGDRFQAWAGFLLLLSVYRLINLLRVLENRLQAERLYDVSCRTSRWLIGGQLVILAGVVLGRHYSVSTNQWLYGLAIAQLAVAFTLLASTLRHLRTTRPPALAKSLSDHDLPTLSVCVPARNETEELEACLRSLVDSDYLKLEILVLDDCSQDKRTPAIIRDYAHAGVRFIAGRTPPQHWLAKNYAYQQLATEANGEVLLFCGVDTRFQPGSLRAIVETALGKNKQMVSLIPRNAIPGRGSIQDLLVQPARYAWEMTLPRRLFQRPPVLSTCWLITAAALQASGGFAATANSISVESYFAGYTSRHTDGYSFLQSDATIGLSSAKSLPEQRATALRVRYPQLRRRPELVALVSLAESALLALPFVLVAAGALAQLWPLVVIAALSSLIQADIYARVVALTYRRFLLRGLWLLPLAAVYDTCLLNYSMWLYEFREVIWKGRNVCIPIMTQNSTNNISRHNN